MLQFPNCKINLGLNVTSKRADGYHNLETVFYPIQLNDALEVIQSTELHFQTTGLEIQGDASSNLCLKAYNFLKADFPLLPAVNIHLHKAIPMGAGLGGGSSNGAFMLSLLNKKFHLQLTEEQLVDYALQLGSDCPFFIINKPCFATSRGEVMTPTTLDLSAYKILIVNPCIHVSTKDAFAGLMPKQPSKSISEIILQPIETWKHELVNDFEASIFPKHPEIEKIKTDLYNIGAIYASMTGTGSTVYGLFRKKAEIDMRAFTNYFHH
jgi:4-diphosphocytidyl-2-C-methyl-D-erythritol kinase